MRTASALPLSIAATKAVFVSPQRPLTLAPASSRAASTSTLPFSAAAIKGVMPVLAGVSGDAPRASSCRTMPRWPHSAASVSGLVLPGGASISTVDAERSASSMVSGDNILKAFRSSLMHWPSAGRAGGMQRGVAREIAAADVR